MNLFEYFRAKVRVMNVLDCTFLLQCLLMDSFTQGSVVEKEKLMSMSSLEKTKMDLLTMLCILSF